MWGRSFFWNSNEYECYESPKKELTFRAFEHLIYCQGHAEREWSDPEWSGITLEWKGVDNKSGGTTLASACVLCLDLLSHVWLRISGGLNCCQKFWRGVV